MAVLNFPLRDDFFTFLGGSVAGAAAGAALAEDFFFTSDIGLMWIACLCVWTAEEEEVTDSASTQMTFNCLLFKTSDQNSS